MTKKDFWHNSRVAVIGAGSFGTVLANLLSKNCRDVRLWVRSEDQARAINATRMNEPYLPELRLNQEVHALSDLERVFGSGEGGVQAVFWALPSDVCRREAKKLAPFFRGDEILIHGTKGVEEGTLKRISQVLREELPCPRIGVVTGPNLAHEIARGDVAATVVASVFDEVIEVGQTLLANENFHIYRSSDVVGAEWAGTLKNILAIAAGAVDALKMGWNARALLITRGLAEMVRFGVALGAEESTFLGLAGLGDLLATCSSPFSRNYRVGVRLGKGEKIEAILADLDSTAEGVRTTRNVHAFARSHGIPMPITEGVFQMLEAKVSVREILTELMKRDLGQFGHIEG